MSNPPVVLVTGASRGLGRGIALHCAQAGCSVAVHYGRNQAAAEESVALCRSAAIHKEQEFVAVCGDLASSAERAGILESTLAAFGRVDALVNNAGMAPRTRADVTQTSETSFDEVMTVNLKGPYFLTQLVANHWLEGRDQSRLVGGYKLVFITSISADTASISRGEYCLSKAGLAMAAQLWATRLADHNVQVYELRPGIMETDMTAGVKAQYDRLISEGLVPQRRWGTPEDVGLAVASILTGHHPYSTGTVIHVDGGLHLRRL